MRPPCQRPTISAHYIVCPPWCSHVWTGTASLAIDVTEIVARVAPLAGEGRDGRNLARASPLPPRLILVLMPFRTGAKELPTYPKARGVLPALRRAIPAPRDPDGVRLNIWPRRIGWAIKWFIVWVWLYDNGRGASNRATDIEVIGETSSGLDCGGQNDENH
jgi:hypothetical protein